MTILSLKIVRLPTIAWIVLAGFLLRLGLALIALEHPERAYSPDTQSYFDFAYAILNGQGWEYPSAFRTPGYPFFLAIFLAVVGENSFLIILGQSLLGTVNLSLTYLLGRHFFGEKIGLLAALFLAFSAESITHSFYLLTETLFTFLFLLAVYFLLRGLQDAQQRASLFFIFLAGILFGLAILTRPLMLYYPLLAGALIFAFDRVDRLKKLVVFGLACALLLLPWVIRNGLVVGAPTVSTISAHNLYFYNALAFEARQEKLDEFTLWAIYDQRLAQALHSQQLPATEVNQAKIASTLAREVIFSNLPGYALNHLTHNLNSLLPDTDLLEVFGLNPGQKGTLAVLKQDGLIAAIRHYFYDNFWMIGLLLPVIVFLGINYLGWGLATWQLLWKKHFFPLIVLSLPILYGLLLPGAPSNPRFRVPVMPFICILAASGLYFLLRRSLPVKTRTPKLLND